MAPEHEFAIPVRDLDAGGKSLDFPVRAAWLRSALEGTQVQASGSDGSLELRISKSGTDVVIRGKVRADLVVPCARCLEPATVHIREDLSALAVPAAAMREAGGPGHGHGHGKNHEKGHEKGHAQVQDDDDDDTPEAQGGDADMLQYDGETLVLDGLVRDELLLAIPMIPLCSEGCPGMSGVSDSNQADEQPGASIDPRLRPLLRLKKMTQ